MARLNQTNQGLETESSEEEDSEESDDEGADDAKSAKESAKASAVSSEESDQEESGDSSETASSSSRDEEPEPVDWTKPIWDMLNVLRKSANFNMRHCSIDEAASELEKLPVFEGTHKQAVAAFERSAEPLLRLMNEAKLRKKFNWSTRRIYDELEATLAGEVADVTMQTPGKPGSRESTRHRMKSVLRPSGAGKAHKRTQGAVDEDEDEDEEMDDVAVSSPVARRQGASQPHAQAREDSVDSADSGEDGPSRQLNGHFDPYALPELPPGPEAQEMLDLVAQEARRVGRQNQTGHLKELLGSWMV